MKTLRLLAVSLFILGLSLQLSAGVPNTPTQFTATYTQVSGTVLFNVTLTWLGSGGDDSTKRADGYHVYRANSATEDLSQFDMIATVTQPLQSNYFRFIVERLQAGTYTFFIRAFNGDGESERTALKIVTLTVNNSGGDSTKVFRFTTQPPTSAGLNTTYRYEARAHHWNGDANSHIRYKIISGPDGMTIDSITGNITWTTPSSARTVTVKILAYLDNDDSQKTDQSWTIRVGGDNNNGGGDGCVIVHGNVRDTSNNIMNGTVTAYLIGNNGQISSAMYTATLSNGIFNFRVPAGTYVLRAQGDGFEYEWFENAKEPTQARQFTVACYDTITAEFRVNPLPQEQKYVFSGRVIDASTGQGIPGIVYFYRQINGALGGDPIMVRTNAEGYYEVLLSNRYAYIAKAMGTSDDYIAQYFDHVGSPTLATVLRPTAARDHIDFALSMRQQYNNGMSGQLVDSVGTGVPGRVSAYLIVTRGNESVIDRYRTVETDATGHFTISNLLPGEYLLLGIPSNDPFIPGYYKENAFAVFQWQNATRITVGESVISTPFTIKLRAGDGQRGIIQLKGSVTGRGGYAKGSNEKQAVSPVAGALVVVCDKSGRPVDYTFSAPDGSYQIDNLAIGQNTITADKPEFNLSSQNVTFAANKFVVTDDIQLEALISSVNDDAVSDALLSPNPSRDYITLRCTSRGGAHLVQVVNSMGQKVSSEVMTLENGLNTLKFNTSALSDGAYMIHISSGNSHSTVGFTVVR